MSTNAKIGYGTTLSRGGNVIAEITSITPPNLSADSIDVTTMDSANGYKEFIQGLRDGGECSLEGKFYPGDTNGQIGLLTDFNAGTLQTFVITFPTSMGATWTFTGIVTGFEGDIPMDDAVGFAATIKISGKPVLGITASTGASAATFVQTDGSTALTAAAMTPTFATGTFVYGFTYTTQTAFKPKITASGHTVKIYVDDVYIETISSGVAGSDIAMASVGAKKVQAVVQESGKTAKTYTFMVSRLS